MKIVLKNVWKFLICLRSRNSIGNGLIFSIFGRLSIELCTCEILLLMKTKVRIELIIIDLLITCCLIIQNWSENVDCLLFTRKFLLAEPTHQNWQRNLVKTSAHYHYKTSIARNSIIPSSQQFN